MYTTNYRCVLWVKGTPIELHTFSLHYNDKGWYISTTSLSAFSRREGTRLYEANLKGVTHVDKRVHVMWGDVLWSEEIVTQGLPEIKHDSVWDFYKAIGYDYKKKKYLK